MYILPTIVCFGTVGYKFSTQGKRRTNLKLKNLSTVGIMHTRRKMMIFFMQNMDFLELVLPEHLATKSVRK